MSFGQRFKRLADDGSEHSPAIRSPHGVSRARRGHEQISASDGAVFGGDFARDDANNCKRNFARFDGWIVNIMRSCKQAWFGGVDSGHQCCIWMTGEGQIAISSLIDLQYIARLILGALAAHGERFSEVSPTRLESAIGVSHTVGVNPELMHAASHTQVEVATAGIDYDAAIDVAVLATGHH